MDARTAEDGKIVQAYEEGTLGVQLAKREQMLIDLRTSDDSAQIQFFIFPGNLAKPPQSLPELQDLAKKTTLSRWMLKGGQGQSPAIFRNIPPGDYAVCIIASAPLDPATSAVLARAEAILAAENGGLYDGQRLVAIIEKAKIESGYEPTPLDFTGSEVLCLGVEITADPASRVIIIERRDRPPGRLG